MRCRHCHSELTLPLVDLGSAPPSNAFLTQENLQTPELWYPLRVLVCQECWLVQTEDFARADELFEASYVYFSSYSATWLQHASRYVDDMVKRFDLTPQSLVIEVAANDGYLLQYVKDKAIPCLGIEPTKGTAAAAIAKGIPVIEDFFGSTLADALASNGKRADLTAANNVLAHVPDINDFVGAFRRVLKPKGVSTFEFPHLLRLLQDVQFDTIYHEHFSYLSLIAVERIFHANGLDVFDVEELPTHGGSLRVYAQRADTGSRARTGRVDTILNTERAAAMDRPQGYSGFQERADRVKNCFLSHLLEARGAGRLVVGYGAAAKGNTLLNYAGVRPDLIGYVVDRNPAKRGKFLPGSRIPVVAEDRLRASRPDEIIILPWNLWAEVEQQLAFVRDWGCRFVTAVPELRVH
jgi:SAM-dependent methyltransferase